MITLIAMLIATPFGISHAAVFPTGHSTLEPQPAVVDLTGRWQLNADLSDKPPRPREGSAPGARGGEGPQPGARPPGGGHPGGMGGGGMGSGGMRGGGMPPGGEGRRPDPEQMAKLRDAMRATLDAPAEMIVTRKDDEVVFTAAGTGDVTRILVTGKKMKTTAGGAEHDVKAEYKEGALLVESSFGPIKVLDTWRVSPDGKQLERITNLEGGGDKRQVRRVYERVEDASPSGAQL